MLHQDGWLPFRHREQMSQEHVVRRGIGTAGIKNDGNPQEARKCMPPEQVQDGIQRTSALDGKQHRLL